MAAILDHTLEQTLLPDSRGPGLEAIVTAFWARQSSKNLSESFQAYLLYYKNQCQFEIQSDHSAKSLRDIEKIVAHINQNPTVPKDELRRSLNAKYQHFSDNADHMSNSIELAVRLWLMVNIRTLSTSKAINLDTSLSWPESASISDVARSYFLGPTSRHGWLRTKQRFSRLLTVHNLEKIGGFHIEWTDNLIDHLRLRNNDTVCLYYHVEILRRMKGVVSREILPQTLFDETLNTLSLLIPRVDSNCYRWLKRNQKLHVLDPEIKLLAPAPREIDRYQHWRDRLLIIEEAFEESEPSTLSQWWHDRRKKVQWYTFWVAVLVLILTIFFGLMQSISGIVQAWASVQALRGSAARTGGRSS